MAIKSQPATQRFLLRWYWALLVPAMLFTAAVFLLRRQGLAPQTPPEFLSTLGTMVFTLAATCAVALPILYRARFAQRWAGEKTLNEERFLRFERNLLILVLTAPYAALIGYFLGLAKFHVSGAFLFALYGVYYFYPNVRRIRHDSRLFRVEFTEEEKTP